MITEEIGVKKEIGSFETFVLRYQTPMLGYLERQLKDPNRAEDLMQETFMKLYCQLKERQAPDHVPAWLYRVAGNLCRDYWRSAGCNKEKAVLDRLPEQRDGGVQPEEFCEQRERRVEMDLLMSELPDMQRRMIFLRYYKDMKLHEIADLMDCPIGTVKSRIFHALRYLRDRIEEKGGMD